MDLHVLEVGQHDFSAGNAKLHSGMCQTLSGIVYKVLGIFPALEAARPRSKCGIQALCSLHVSIEKCKNLLQHCSYSSKLYLAITGDSILMKFEKARRILEDSLRRVEDIVPQSIGCQVLEILSELERAVFSLDPIEKQVGDDVIMLLQRGKNDDGNCNDFNERKTFHQSVLRLDITSSSAALAERRALKRLIERARIEEDKRKESIISYLLYLMKKYSKAFRSGSSVDIDYEESTPCSPAVHSAKNGNRCSFDWKLSKLDSFIDKTNGRRSGSIPMPPEEFRCPISLQLMYDPVIISSGQTYERACIEKWFHDGHSTCPKTQQQLSHLSLTPNYCVKGLITSWCEQNGIPMPDGPPGSLDLNYWRLALSDSDNANSQSMESIGSWELKGVKENPLEESAIVGKVENAICDKDSSFNDLDNKDVFERCKGLLAVLNEGESFSSRVKAVEEIRFLLKDDEEARIFMGSSSFVDALVQFLRTAIHEENDEVQEIGAMALFNLAVNNDRNKEMILSAGIIPLLEIMITNLKAYKPAIALYLNLTSLHEAKSIVGSSQALPFLVHLLQVDCGAQCKLDALHALFNLSMHPPNIPLLPKTGIVAGLHALLMANEGSGNHTWTEISIAILINLASNPSGKNEIISTPGLIAELATILNMGDLVEQEQAVSCILILCEDDEKCRQLVLQEGVIPALVSLSANGSTTVKEEAQKLLMLFREHRQREAHEHLPASFSSAAETNGMALEEKPLRKSSFIKFRRSWASGCRGKHFSLHPNC